MPYKPKTNCKYPQCPNLIETKDRYCPECKKMVNLQYEKTRETAVKRGYDTRHKKWRSMVLARYPICDICNGAISTVAHHRDNNAKNNAMSNGQGLCKSCHDRLHAKKGERWGSAPKIV